MPVTLDLIGVESRKSAGKSRARVGVSPGSVGGTPATNEQENQALVKKLGELLTSNDLENAVEVWRDGLKAVRMVWNNKRGEYLEAGPDWQIRRDMSELIAAYMEGKPMERQMSISGSFAELGEMINEMRLSNEALRLMPFVHSLPTTAEATE